VLPMTHNDLLPSNPGNFHPPSPRFRLLHLFLYHSPPKSFILSGDRPMTLLDAPSYDPAKARLRNIKIVIVLAAVVVLAALVGLTTIFLALEPHPGEGGARLTLALVACGPMLLCAGGASRLRGLSSPAPCRP